MRDGHRFVCVVRSFPVLVDLAVERADLHVGLALVLQQFQLLRWHGRVVKHFLNGFRLDVLEALFEADRALVEHAQLLEAKRHVVGDQ